MIDLVKYLRAHVAPDRPCNRTEQDIACGQAADEIERLRRELAEARGLLREARGPVDHAARYAFGHLHTEVAEDLFALVNRIDKAIASDQPKPVNVGCEREDGTLNIHAETETCEVCASDKSSATAP